VRSTRSVEDGIPTQSVGTSSPESGAMKRVNDKEFAAVSALPAPERYGHFVGQVADWQEVWSLRAPSGWMIVGDDEGRECVPVWPHKCYAEACATGEWEGFEAAAIPLSRWLEAWIPGISRDGRAVAVFPVSGGRGIVVTAERLRDDLLEASRQFLRDEESEDSET
jgi:hypothetical protein